MKSKIEKLLVLLPEEDYERALIFLSQEDYNSINKIVKKLIHKLEKLTDCIAECLLCGEEVEEEY